MRRRALLAGAGGLVLAAPAVWGQARAIGVALVIGNSKYQWEAPLPNVRRDAPDIAKRFQELGLKTELLQDAGSDAMSGAIEKFKAAASGANLAAFYFAGHGASWEKETYLVPVDADLGSATVVRTLPPVKAISAAMAGARNRLLVFDNCRNNPADGWRQRAASEQSRVAASELAAIAVHGPNTLVVFSTAPGRIALDGPAGENSPFAAAFLRQLGTSSVDLSVLGGLLRRDLLIATEGQQVIWDESTYTAPFVVKGLPTSAARASPSPIESSRIVELPKAYAFAREKKLSLPPGLVAIRPSADQSHGQMPGTYEFTWKVYIGGGTGGVGRSMEPSILGVISLPDSDRAQVIYASRYELSVGSRSDFAGGTYWRFVVGRVSRSEIEWDVQSSDGLLDNYSAKWTDANSGIFSNWSHRPLLAPPKSRFTRLDG